jgi:transcription elongation GreA/GreB family factor
MKDPEVHDPYSVRHDTPLGKALMGARVGETVEVTLHVSLPVRRLTILGIEPHRT